MSEQASPRRYQWLVIQDGQLPLRPDGSLDMAVEHRCTITVIWPEGARAVSVNSLMIDPCFSESGYAQAERRMNARGLALEDVGRMLVTHLHADHMLHTPYHLPALRMRPFRPGEPGDPLDGIRLLSLPGHHPLLLAPVFVDSNGLRVAVASDAVLSEDWLRAWRYYWPNRYGETEIVQTWRSVAHLLTEADLVVPGHGMPFAVTPALVGALIESFVRAEYAARCPDVADALRARLARLVRQ